MDYVKQSKKGLFFRRKSVLMAGAAIVVAAFCAALSLGRAVPAADRDSLWMEAATRGDMRREIRAAGTLVPRDIRWVTAGVGGAVEEVLVEPGSRTQAITPIIRLSNPAVLSRLASAKATLDGARAQVAAKQAQLQSSLLDQQAALASARSEFETTRIKTEAMKKALAAGALSKMDLEQNEIALEQRRQLLEIERHRVKAFDANMAAQLNAERAKEAEAEGALQIAQQEANALVVTAGIDGILQQVPVDVGQQVTAGQNLARVAQPEKLMARLQVPEMQAKDLVIELPADIDLHSAHAHGKVARIDPAVKNGSVTVDVRFDGPMPEGARPELSVDGKLVLGRVADVVSIPRPAGASAGQGGSLFVAKAGSNVAHRVPVTFGPASTDRITVTGGIDAGDMVILSDTSRWSGADSLRIE